MRCLTILWNDASVLTFETAALRQYIFLRNWHYFHDFITLKTFEFLQKYAFFPWYLVFPKKQPSRKTSQWEQHLNQPYNSLMRRWSNITMNFFERTKFDLTSANLCKYCIIDSCKWSLRIRNFTLARYIHELVDAGKECTTDHIEKGRFDTALECANACGLEYTAFTYQKNCSSQCLCYCSPRSCGLQNSTNQDFYLISDGKQYIIGFHKIISLFSDTVEPLKTDTPRDRPKCPF